MIRATDIVWLTDKKCCNCSADHFHVLVLRIDALVETITMHYMLVVVARYLQLILRQRSRGERPFLQVRKKGRTAEIGHRSLVRTGPWGTCARARGNT